MSRPHLALGLLCAAVAAAGAVPVTASAAGGVELTPARGPAFPARSFVLTVPPGPAAGRAGEPGAARVTENGVPAAGVTVTPAAGSRTGDFAAVLVLDASRSMRGGRIEGAVRAARALAVRRPAGERLAVVAFNRGTRLLTPLTADAGVIAGALSGPPPLAGETHVFDAVDAALAELRRGRATAGTVVVLSDGSDTGSRLTAAAVATRARRAHVRVFGVGLRPRRRGRAQLEALASATGGRYVEARDARQLAGIFSALGARMSAEYLIRFRSTGRPGSMVDVAVTVRGVPGVATSRYRAPGAAPAPKASRWTTPAATVLAALLAAGLLGFAALVLLLRRTAPRGLEARLAGFVTLPADEPREPLMVGRVRSGAGRKLRRLRWWPGFATSLGLAGIDRDPVRVAGRIVAVTLAAGGLAVLATGAAVAAAAGLVVPVVVRVAVRRRIARRRALFADQLPDTIEGAVAGIRAGQGMIAALWTVAELAAEPTKGELLRALADERLGVPMEEALAELESRMACHDLQQVSFAITIQREAGGNVAEVLSGVSSSLRERAELRRRLRSLTAQGRLSRNVVTALPIGLLAFLAVANPGYVSPLFHTTAGLIMLAAGAVLLGAGSLAIKRIVSFES